MSRQLIIYSLVALFSVFLGAVSQVLLKKSAQKVYPTKIAEYLNPLVLIAYSIFFITTLITMFAYKVIPLSLGPILEATSYFYITFFGVKFFDEKINKKKVIALILIVVGIIIYTLF